MQAMVSVFALNLKHVSFVVLKYFLVTGLLVSIFAIIAFSSLSSTAATTMSAKGQPSNGRLSAVLSSAELYDPTAKTWTIATKMHHERFFHTATVLTNGKVLVTGGVSISGNGSKTAELYDPSTGNWTITDDMHYERIGHTASLLANGKVLVTGGTTTSDADVVLKSAELYDPSTGKWVATVDMHYARYVHTTTVLMNGKVLVTGGSNSDSASLNSAELFDPSTETWTNTSTMTHRRGGHRASFLNNGKVLITGGMNDTASIKATELYDPSTGLWRTTDDMHHVRCLHGASILPNAKVLVTGGSSTYYEHGTNTSELYDLSTVAWTNITSMNRERYWHTASVLTNGNVLIAGGCTAIPFTTTIKFYNSSFKTFIPVNDMKNAQSSNKGTVLANRKIFVFL